MADKRIRIDAGEMQAEFERILSSLGFNERRAAECASVFVESSVDGVYSHGVLRFPRFVRYIQKGYVDVHAEPIRVASLGALEQWDGQLGPGPLNAIFAAERAERLADEHGMGLVALGHTNHWMRGGTYGWRVAKDGYGYMGWTNTEPNMPAWGAKQSRLGNNPIVFALPFGDEAIVLDMAMTQFAYGKLEDYKLRGQKLPLPGGFDANGNLSDDPAAILDTMLGLPIGYWKGAGLSLMLDLFASALSGGDDTRRIGERPDEYGVSQLFFAFRLQALPNFDAIQKNIAATIDYYKNTEALSGMEIVYPGERVLKTRAENLAHGIPVAKSIWQQIRSF